MTDPDTKDPAPGESTAGQTLLVVLGSVVLVVLTCCLGSCGALFVAIQRHEAYVTAELKKGELWLERERLAECYAAAFDEVSGNNDMLDSLGAPVVVESQPELPFRCINKDKLDQAEPVIEFTIRGPRGHARVTVIASGTGEAWHGIHRNYHPASITAVLVDGSEFTILPSPEINMPTSDRG